MIQEQNNQNLNNYKIEENNTFLDNQTTKKKNSNKQYKKSKLVSIVVTSVLIVGVGITLFNNINDSKNDNITNISNNNDSEKLTINYYDKTRDIKDNYTFREAISKFAFIINEKTLIFKENSKISLDNIIQDSEHYDEIMKVEFSYKNDEDSTLYELMLGESSSTNLTEFVENFKKGKLRNDNNLIVENVEIIEQNENYVFITWERTIISKTYGYYFAQKIDDKVFYAYKNSIKKYDEKNKSAFLSGSKELFNCLSIDDGKEPYICDKVINIPLVLNKKIKNYNSFYAIYNEQITNKKIDGSVHFSYNDDLVRFKYNANVKYEDIEWEQDFNSKIKYKKEDDTHILGIKDEKLTQIFEISSYTGTEITNDKNFNEYIDKMLSKNS